MPEIDWRALTDEEFQRAFIGCGAENERRICLMWGPGQATDLAGKYATAVTGVDCTSPSVTPPEWQALPTGWPPFARVTHAGRTFTNGAAINSAEPSDDCAHCGWTADPVESTEGAPS
jgi:hypothetical protein